MNSLYVVVCDIFIYRWSPRTTSLRGIILMAMLKFMDGIQLKENVLYIDICTIPTKPRNFVLNGWPQWFQHAQNLGLRCVFEKYEPIRGSSLKLAVDSWVFWMPKFLSCFMILLSTLIQSFLIRHCWQQVGLTYLYGIKVQDMEYYLLFALVIIFFQLCVDVFIHGVLELLHGWKIYDYLVSATWKG